MSALKRNATSGPYRTPPSRGRSTRGAARHEVLHARSVSLTPTDEGIVEPSVLRRVDGSSVHSCWIGPVYLRPDPGRRAATRRGGGPHRRTRPGRRHCGARLAQDRLPNRAQFGRRTGWSGSCRISPSTARLRLAITRRRQENHRHAPTSRRGATAAATSSGWPHRRRGAHPRRPQLHQPKQRPSSPGPSTTMTCPSGRNASASPAWLSSTKPGWPTPLPGHRRPVHHRPRRQHPAYR